MRWGSVVGTDRYGTLISDGCAWRPGTRFKVTMEWQPLSVRRGQSPPLARTHELPAHLIAPVRAFLSSWLTVVNEFGDRRPKATVISDLCLRIQQSQNAQPSDTLATILRGVRESPRFAFDVLDALLAMGEIDARALESLLDRGGSTCCVAADGKSIEWRVSPPAAEAFDRATKPEDGASKHLATAWHAAHGIDPDPKEACEEATRAVESVLKPITSPKDKVATFGKMKAAIRNSPSSFAFELDDDPAAFITHLELAGYQAGRHGGDDKAPPTLAQARAIVQAAVMVVEWLRTGVFRRAK